MSDKCLICESECFEDFLIKEDFSIVQCRCCNFVFVSPLPDEEELKLSYAEGNYRANKRLGRRIKYRMRVKLIKRFIKGTGKILDIGCSQGDFGLAFKKEKWEYFGIDLTKSAVNHARSLGLNASYGEIKDHNFPSDYFDMITIFHTIEHIYNLNDTLKEVRRVLAKDGIVVIKTPDVEHPRSKKQGLDWKYFGPPHHIWYFSKKTLQDLLQKNGFNILYARKALGKMHVTVYAMNMK